MNKHTKNRCVHIIHEQEVLNREKIGKFMCPCAIFLLLLPVIFCTKFANLSMNRATEWNKKFAHSLPLHIGGQKKWFVTIVCLNACYAVRRFDQCNVGRARSSHLFLFSLLFFSHIFNLSIGSVYTFEHCWDIFFVVAALN